MTIDEITFIPTLEQRKECDRTIKELQRAVTLSLVWAFMEMLIKDGKVIEESEAIKESEK